MQTTQQRHSIYESLYREAVALYKASGVHGVAQYLHTVMIDQNAEDDLTFMRLTACIRAEGIEVPTVPFITSVLRLVKDKWGGIPEPRAEMLRDMLTKISADMCHELVVRAMHTARHLAMALGAEIDISATTRSEDDGEWSTLESAVPVGSFLH